MRQLFLFDIPKPADVGVPHPSWRPAQLDAYLKVRDMDRHGGGVFFGDLSTGSGKSAVAAALGHSRPVLVLVKTLGLLDQYVNEYGFAGVKGRQEYRCVHPEKLARWSGRYNRIPTAFDCHLERMAGCSEYAYCPYVLAKHRALSAMRTVCTYRYAAVSQLMQRRGGIVVMDEAHAVPSELFGLQEFVLREKEREHFSLPDFPDLDYDERGDILSLFARHKLAGWLASCVKALDGWEDGLELDDARAHRLQRRCQRALDELEGCNWFLQVLPDKLLLKSLDARPVGRKLLGNKRTALLMSATIGKPDAIAAELDIEDYQYECYPNPVPASARPVFDLGFERMTKANLDRHPSLYKEQADVIWKWLKELDLSWRGLILTSSYRKIDRLKEHLGARLGGRLFHSNKKGVTGRIADFLEDPRRGLVAIDTIQGWGHGLDLRGDLGRFVVVAGVHFANPTDPYVLARRRITNGDRYYWWKAYTGVPQACGRVSRGDRERDGLWQMNYAAIADGSGTSPKAMKHYPEWFVIQ